MLLLPSLRNDRGSALEHAEDVLLAHDQVLLAVQLHFGPRVLPEQDPVPDFHVQGRHLAVVVHLALADSDDLSLVRLLLGGIRNDDAALGLLHLVLDALDEHTILKWPDLHADSSFPTLPNA